MTSSDQSSLDHYLKPLESLMLDPSITEICIQEQGTVYIERHNGWSRIENDVFTNQWCRHLAQLVATSTSQRVNAQCPLLSAGLPRGERLQVVLPPATLPDHVVIAIRKPNHALLSLEELKRGGFFSQVKVNEPVKPCDELVETFRSKRWTEFLRVAVQSRLNIVVAGATGSDRTTLTNALIAEIPSTERLISIEDTPELDFVKHPNSVRLLYSKDSQGVAKVTPKQLLEASLRLRPDRIMLAELRGEEAYYYCRNISSGHAGSITSIHAGSPATTFIQLAFLIKESGPGREMSSRDIKRMLRATIDLIVVCGRSHGQRGIKSLWWRDEPQALNQSNSH
jgi:type IV secretion system protein VirB11